MLDLDFIILYLISCFKKQSLLNYLNITEIINQNRIVYSDGNGLIWFNLNTLIESKLRHKSQEGKSLYDTVLNPYYKK